MNAHTTLISKFAGLKKGFFQPVISVFLVGLLLTVESLAAGVDVNDVSFLFPIRNRKLVPEVTIGNHILSKNIFDDVIRFEFPDTPTEKLPYADASAISDIENWMVTSFRFELCGDKLSSSHIFEGAIIQIDKAAGCQAKLRVVAQPLDTFLQPSPSALHIIYSIKDEFQTEAIERLLKIQSISLNDLGVQTSGLPLQVHPGLLKESFLGKVVLQNEIKSFLTDFASVQSSRSQLSVVTLNIQTRPNHWKMVGGLVQGNKWTKFVSKNSMDSFSKDDSLKMGVEEIECNLYSACKSNPSVSPSSSGLTDLTYLFKTDAQGKMQPKQENEIVQEMAETIINTRKTSFFHTNCLSCHVASSFVNKNLLKTAQAWPKGITPFLPPNFIEPDISRNILSFAYFGRTPRISLRTANESAFVAYEINQLLNEKNPSREIQNLSQFWNCIFKFEFKECFDQQITTKEY